MTNFYESNKLFEGHGVIEKTSNHSIVCTNKTMTKLNLSIFTRDSLKEWLNIESNLNHLVAIVEIEDKDSPNPVYKKLKDINPPLQKRNIIYGNKDKYLNINVWRTANRNGFYEKFTFLTDWNITDNYTILSGVEYKNFPSTAPGAYEYKWQDILDTYEIEAVQDAVRLDPEDHIMEYLIALNDYIQNKLIEQPIEKEEAGKIGLKWEKAEVAAYEFFIDVNSSKERCISWKNNYLTFKRRELVKDRTGRTKITDENENKQVLHEGPKEIPLKLYFFSLSNKRKTERKVGLKNVNIVSAKKNAAGEKYVVKDNGLMYHNFDEKNPKSHTAGELDIKYTELLNRWESGTPQMMAIMTTNLPAVEKPDLSVFMEKDCSEILNHETGLGVSQGSAMPIMMDNCNPLQWCPNFKNDERLRDPDDKQKLEVKVYNLSDTTGFSSGDIVILNRIDGVWIPLPYASGFVPDTPRVPSFGKWDFSYLMTNTDYFFKAGIAPTPDAQDHKITHEEFEQGLYKAYYVQDRLNKDYYSSADESNALVRDGFFQVTSWDFMGESIGGLRKYGNALACTQFNYYPDGTLIENNGEQQKYISGPFFGCVFPDGYDDEEKVKILKNTEKDFDIKPTGAKDIHDQQHVFFKEIISNKNVFENDNTNILSSAKGGMFNHGNINQLPADIATNCSPDGVNGRPLSLLRILPTGIQDLQKQFKDYFSNITPVEGDIKIARRYAWMYQHPRNLEPPLTMSDVKNSAFDIKPQNNRKIQFRPLKTETYAIFEIADKFELNGRTNERGEFATQMWATQNTIGEPPISLDAVTRNNLQPSLNKLYDEDKGLLYENSVSVTPQESNFNPDLLWDRNWIKFDGNVSSKPMGNAFGIIGAVCTASFNDKIEFVLDNYIGMHNWFLNGVFYPSWKKSLYNDYHTTQLSVRCFHSWPREQTIYDSRFFAVHHFNEGVDKQEDQNGKLDAEDQEEVNNNGMILGVDFLEIITPSLNQKVYENSTPFVSGVATRRRGKLLPYTYQYNTLGVGPHSYLFVKDQNPPEKAQNTNIFIKASGENYNENDRFIVNGGNGEGVLLKPKVDKENGGIIEFEVVHSGYNFLQSDFLAQETGLTLDTTSSLSVAPSGSVTGNGLNAIIVGGTVVNSPQFIDEKPKQIFSRQLTPSQIPQENAVNTINNLQNIEEVSFGVDLTEQQRSKNNEYDLFFFFTNDISHTWDNDYNKTPPAYEQKLDLTINLDPNS